MNPKRCHFEIIFNILANKYAISVNISFKT